MWRTPTYDEWDYLLLRRAASTVAGVTNARYTKATIDYNIWGMIIFPDNFTLPATIPTINSINNPGSSMSSNSFTMDEWEQLEQNGAIFLPLAGCRNGCVGQGVYWSSTYSSEEQSYLLYFESNITVIQGGPRRMPASVRLVKD